MESNIGVRNLAQGVWLQALYNVLEREHGIAFQPIEAKRTSRVLAYRVMLMSPRHLGTVVKPSLEEELAYSFGVDYVRVARYRGEVLVEVLLPKSYHRPLPASTLERRGRRWLTLGQTVRGNQVAINMGGSRYAHALVTATTGGGKTFAMRLMAWELIVQNQPNQASLVIIDGKGGYDWNDFRHVPHLVMPVVTDPVEAKAVLASVLKETEERAKNQRTRPGLYLFIDEIRELLAKTGGASGAAAEACQRIAQIGRGLNIHLVMATQHPTADVLGGSLTKANLPLRLVGRVMDAKASNLATGQDGMRAHKLYGAGDFLAVDGATAHRFQVAALTPALVDNLPRAARYNHGGVSLDLDLDLARMVGMVVNRKKPQQVTPSLAAWALWDMLHRGLDQPSATAIREALKVGTPRAQAVRDFAATFRTEFEKLGGLLATGYSNGPPVGRRSVAELLPSG